MNAEWQEIRFWDNVGREVVSMAAGAFAISFVLPTAILLILGVRTYLPYAVGGSLGAVASLLIGYLYGSEYRKSTSRFATNSEGIQYVNRNGTGLDEGLVRFREVAEITASASQSGGVEIRLLNGTRVRLGPGFGYSTRAFGSVIESLSRWASARGLEVNQPVSASPLTSSKRFVVREASSGAPLTAVDRMRASEPRIWYVLEMTIGVACFLTIMVGAILAGFGDLVGAGLFWTASALLLTLAIAIALATR